MAIKKIKVREMKDGLDMSAIREIRALKELHHPNIIEVLDTERLTSSSSRFTCNATTLT